MSTSRSRATARAFAATAAVGTTVLLTAPVASAATGDGSYVPEPTMDVSVRNPLCDGDVPLLEYAVEVEGSDSDTLTITWLNPDGDDVVQTDLPLSGRVPWPGAVVGPDGRGEDWPGWRLEDGEWVEGDEFDWVRPSVDVLFEVNPEAMVTVDYPASAPECATNPPGEDEPAPPASQVSDEQPAAAGDQSLASTGATVGLYAAIAAGLAAVGAAIVLLTRRTRQG